MCSADGGEFRVRKYAHARAENSADTTAVPHGSHTRTCTRAENSSIIPSPVIARPLF